MVSFLPFAPGSADRLRATGVSGGCSTSELLSSDVQALLVSLREDFHAAAYDTESLAAAIGTASAAATRGFRLPVERQLRERAERGEATAADTVVALFFAGLPRCQREVDTVFRQTTASGLASLGFVELRDRGDGDRVVVPTVDIVPHRFMDDLGVAEYWIASDQAELSRGEALPENFVLGVGGATTSLAQLAVHDSVDSLFELGTGSGVLALLATRYARTVSASDISLRALAFTAANSILNKTAEVNLRLGNLFEPVAGMQFDRILSNPPFVITPRGTGVPSYEYRDGGMIGDGLIRAVVEGLEPHLLPGGIAQLLGNWEYRADTEQPELGPVREWLRETALGGWCIERERQSAASYAETWIRDGGTLPRTPEFDSLYTAWVDDFAERGVAAVGFGYLNFRAPSEHSGLVPLEFEARGEPLGNNPFGLRTVVTARLRMATLLQSTSDKDFLTLRPIVATDITEHRHYLPGEENPAVIQLVQGGGFGRTVNADTALAACVGACDGELSIGAISAALSSLLDANERELTRVLVERLRELLLAGFLTLAELED